MAKYKLIKDGPPWSYGAKTGDIVYDCVKPDYGLSGDDTAHFEEEYISVTRDADGDYPFFTIPVSSLERID